MLTYMGEYKLKVAGSIHDIVKPGKPLLISAPASCWNNETHGNFLLDWKICISINHGLFHNTVSTHICRILKQWIIFFLYSWCIIYINAGFCCKLSAIWLISHLQVTQTLQSNCLFLLRKVPNWLKWPGSI